MNASDAGRDPVEILAEEYVSRRRRHEAVKVADYARAYPHLADRIETIFAAAELLESLAPAPAVDVPERIGEFRVIRQIGRGGMGEVYEAVQTSLQRRVALKILPPELARNPTYLSRFHNEARTASSLHHTNIVAIHGAGEADGRQFLVMQLIDGVGLDRVLAGLRGSTPLGAAETNSVGSTSAVHVAAAGHDAPSLTRLHRADRKGYFRAVAKLIADAADGLALAHQTGITHRDIKPSNLLLERSGTIFVTDFGLAKADGADDLTSPGTVVGTARYIAPERFEGNDSPAADVFSLGATLYELLTVRPAFDAPTRDALIRQIQRQEPVRPRSIDSAIPRDLETIALAALRKDPARRPAAAAVADDCRRWLDGRAIAARRVGPVERWLKWVRRNPLVATTTSGLAVSLVAGLTTALVLWRTSEGHRASAQAAAEAAGRSARAAEAALGRSLDALDQYFQQVSESQLLNVPGLQPLRRDLMTSALVFYNQFLETHERHPRLRRERGRALLNAGRIEAHIGTVPKARELLDEAYRELRELHGESPDDVMVARSLQRTADALGTVRLLDNRPAEARAFFLESARLSAQLPDPFARFTGVWSCLRAAETAVSLGRMKEALSDIEAARERLPAIPGRPKESVEIQICAARADILEAEALRERDRDAAAGRATAARDRLRPAVQAGTAEMGVRREYARSLMTLGVCEMTRGRHDAAAAAHAEAVPVMEALVSENPQVRDLQLGLTSALRHAANAQRQLRQYDAATQSADRCITLLNAMLADKPDDTQLLGKLAEATTEEGMIHLRSERYEPAAESFQRSMNLLLRSGRHQPDAPALLSRYAATENNLAMTRARQGRFDDVVTLIRDAIAKQSAALAAPDPPPAARGYLVTHYGWLWTALRELRRWSELESAAGDYLARFPNSPTAHLRVAREYAECLPALMPGVGPPTEEQAHIAERFAAGSVRHVEQAFRINASVARREFASPTFKGLERRADYQAVIARYRDDAAGDK